MYIFRPAPVPPTTSSDRRRSGWWLATRMAKPRVVAYQLLNAKWKLFNLPVVAINPYPGRWKGICNTYPVYSDLRRDVCGNVSPYRMIHNCVTPENCSRMKECHANVYPRARFQSERSRLNFRSNFSSRSNKGASFFELFEHPIVPFIPASLNRSIAVFNTHNFSYYLRFIVQITKANNTTSC